MICQINTNVYFTSSNAALAAKKEASSLESAHFLEVGGASGNGADLQLRVVLAFCETLSSTVDARPGVPIDSIEALVQRVVKNWEVESHHISDVNQWKTMETSTFKAL